MRLLSRRVLMVEIQMSVYCVINCIDRIQFSTYYNKLYLNIIELNQLDQKYVLTVRQ